jgi:hypothetical protein
MHDGQVNKRELVGVDTYDIGIRQSSGVLLIA